MGVGENIIRIREKKGISQADLAREIKVTASMMCQIERGTKACSLQLGAAIAKILGCDIEELVS